MKQQMSLLFLAMNCVAHVRGDEFFPLVPDDLEVSLFASEPLVRNPCALTFDARGRLFVGMGPQYRNPHPDTPGDSVFILIDEDGDGDADSRREFATGFNSIQGLAWRGNQLWVANAPDLTVVRDLDGDDVADEYVRIYTDLGNLEHGLHGLNWAPDGKLYMSKGNSKGLTQPPGRIAPRPFRELWGVDDAGLPDLPTPEVFSRETYRGNYHDPQDDWGREGGILRCDPDGTNLEIVARGFRNPWDIAFDDTFTWLGTDNDQTLGDKFFSPFRGAHFGWGHSWSFDWSGEGHLPTVPASGPLFEGSGAGIVFCNLARYPARYRGVFLVNDWLNRKVYLYRPSWNGALMVPREPVFDWLASAGGGRTMERSFGRQFDPVDIEIGPDEAIYLSSWGRDYGVRFRQGTMANEGRIYRLWPKAAPPIAAAKPHRSRPINQWSEEELLADLGSHLPVWRINAQEELVRRGAADEVRAVLERRPITTALETWAAWTLGRMNPQSIELDSSILDRALSPAASLNLHIQSVRILAHRGRLPDRLVELLSSHEARLRFECLLAIRQAGATEWTGKILDLAASEDDRLVYYAAWGALRALVPSAERRPLLADSRPAVRRAVLLGLLEDDAVDVPTLQHLTNDSDRLTAALARQRLDGKAAMVIRGRPLRSASVRSAGITSNAGSSRPAVQVSDVLPLLPQADARTGHELFLGDRHAGCVACHRLGNQGNAFAPDLSVIGARTDAQFIVTSILEPGTHITEGFVLHTIEATDNEVYSGILLEETGSAVKLALATGEPVSVPRSMIRSRQTSSQSAMPSNYGELLTARQVADLAAFLQTLGRPEAGATTPARFSIRRGANSFDIFLGDQAVATWLFRHPELTRPALVNVRTPDGIPVTREFPGPTNADHRWMHPGIAMSFGNLDGQDYWRFRARVEQLEFVEEPTAQTDRVSWAVRNRYESESGGHVVCVEEARYSLRRDPAGLVLEWDSTFRNDERDFYFGDQEESGLCVRVADALRVNGGHGTILNDRGERNEAGTWGREFRWIDYSGGIGDERVGLLIVPHAENPRPCWSHSRDYGVVVANPFPRQPREQREPFVKTPVRRGEPYRLRFTILIYEAPAGASVEERTP